MVQPQSEVKIDPALLQRFVVTRVLQEPKGAALEAQQRFAAGETPQQIADNRERPIQVRMAPLALPPRSTLLWRACVQRLSGAVVVELMQSGSCCA